MPTSIQTATVAVPLLFVVVVALSAAGREIDLKAIAKSDESSAFLFTSLGEYIPFPKLGRFNFIHGMNTVLLAGALVIEAVFLTGEGGLKIVLVAVTWLGWLTSSPR